MTNKEKNPPMSGNSEEGATGTYPNIYDINSISQHHINFNSGDKFNLNSLKNVKGGNGQYTALCPAHDDRNASLSVRITHDKVLLHCHAGCAVSEILSALGLPASALFLGEEVKKKPRQKDRPRQTNTVTYEYLYPDGSLAYRKLRYEYSDGSKTFAFFDPYGKKGVTGLRRVPYNLPSVLSADTVYFVEGEKAARAAIDAGRVATSLDAGAKSRWLSEYTAYFEGKNVIILPDNDEPGMAYAWSIAQHLPDAKIVRLPDLPEKGDIYDWLASGRTMDDIDTLPFEKPDEKTMTENAAYDFLPNKFGFMHINPFETRETKNRYRWNDIGISNLFADCYKNINRYVPEANAWFVYNGRVWKQDVGGVTVADQAKRFMYYLLISCQKHINDDDTRGQWVDFVAKRMKKQARDTMVADAASCWPVSLMEFDKNPYIFNCQNCTLDLRTFTVREHNPDDFLSKVSNVVFNKDARCVRWETFVSEIMRGDAETARFLQKALGYTLTGDTSEECFFILYGSTTRNGKGTTMETTLHMLGDYGKTAQPETIAQKQITHGGGPTEDVARLKGARFVNMSEPDKGLRLNSALVKQVTGGDTVTARFLHQNSFEYRPEYKLFINTNYLPNVSDDSIFASGRVKLIPFERHFEENEQDKGLKSLFKQPENISGIFNWFLEGLHQMQAEGLEQTEAVKTATAQYREDSDIVKQFIKDSLIEIKKEKTPIKDLYAEYEKWCEENGCGVLAKNNLTAELRRMGFKIERRDKNIVYLFDYAIAYTGDLPDEWQ